MALPPASLISFRHILRQFKFFKLGDWDKAIAPSSPILLEQRYSFSSLVSVCEAAIANIVKVGVNPFYSGQIKQLVSFKDYAIAVKHPQRKEVWQASVKPTVDFLNDIGLVRTKTMKKWYKKGVLPREFN